MIIVFYILVLSKDIKGLNKPIWDYSGAQYEKQGTGLKLCSLSKKTKNDDDDCSRETTRDMKNDNEPPSTKDFPKTNAQFFKECIFPIKHF